MFCTAIGMLVLAHMGITPPLFMYLFGTALGYFRYTQHIKKGKDPWDQINLFESLTVGICIIAFFRVLFFPNECALWLIAILGFLWYLDGYMIPMPEEKKEAAIDRIKTLIAELQNLPPEHKKYTVKKIVNILGRKLDEEMLSDLGKFILEKNIWKRRNAYPSINPILEEFLEKNSRFWEQRREIHVYKQIVDTISNSKKAVAEDQKITQKIEQFKKQYGLSPFET